MVFIWKFLLGRKIFNKLWYGTPFRNPKKLSQRIFDFSQTVQTKEYWIRLAKLGSLPLAFWFYKLDTCPYTKTKKFYIFDKEQEWKYGRKLVESLYFDDDKDKK